MLRLIRKRATAEKVSVFGAILVRIFPELGLNTERYRVSLRIHFTCGKMRTTTTPNMDTFYTESIGTISRRLSIVKLGKDYAEYFKILSSPNPNKGQLTVHTCAIIIFNSGLIFRAHISLHSLNLPLISSTQTL